MKFFIKDFLGKCDQIRRKLRIWSYSLKKSLMENFIFLCSVSILRYRVQSRFSYFSDILFAWLVEQNNIRRVSVCDWYIVL